MFGKMSPTMSSKVFHFGVTRHKYETVISLKEEETQQDSWPPKNAQTNENLLQMFVGNKYACWNMS